MTISSSASPPELGPSALYTHDHPPIRNAHEEYEEKLGLGQRVAETVTTLVGGWPFIITQTLILLVWIALNIYLSFRWKEKTFDPYPFILLNLVLSFQAAYTGPIVMMSQNRQNQKDRFAAQGDFECNVKAEEEIRVIMEHLIHQDKLLAQLNEVLAYQDQILAHQSSIQEDITARLENLQAQVLHLPSLLSGSLQTSFDA